MEDGGHGVFPVFPHFFPGRRGMAGMSVLRVWPVVTAWLGFTMVGASHKCR